MSLSWKTGPHPEQSVWPVHGDGMVLAPSTWSHTAHSFQAAGSTGDASDTSKDLGRRELCVGQSWINKVKDGRLGAQQVSVLLSPGDDGGDDTEQMCCWDTWQGVSLRKRREEVRRSWDSGRNSRGGFEGEPQT